MAPQHTILLLIISVFFSKGLALKCYECVLDPSTGTCTTNTTTCQSQCSSMTITAYMGDIKMSIQSMKSCALDTYLCLTGSINYGQSRLTQNSQCCNTDLCNSQNTSELPRRPLNGGNCYTCDNSDCSQILPCEGDETQCFTSAVVINDKQETQKGCTSKVFCESNASRASNESRILDGNNIKCCEGNLCNSAQSMRSVIFPLLSLILMLLV